MHYAKSFYNLDKNFNTFSSQYFLFHLSKDLSFIFNLNIWLISLFFVSFYYLFRYLRDKFSLIIFSIFEFQFKKFK